MKKNSCLLWGIVIPLIMLLLHGCRLAQGPTAPPGITLPSTTAVVTSVPTPTSAATATPSRFSAVDVPAPSLANNLIGEKAERSISVYLPTSYSGSSKRYPVVYYLPGYTSRSMMGVSLPHAIDSMVSSGGVKEMIVVIVSGVNELGGSFYVNSPVTGNWEDFVVGDVVNYVDAHYRTIPQASARGISGHSMGGFGALNIAMRHPDIFSAVYSMSPGLFDENGLAESQMFASEVSITNFLAYESRVTALPEEEAKAAMMSPPDSFTLAYGLAFAPNPDKHPPYLDYPYEQTNGQLVRNEATWKKWESGFGDIKDKIQRYKTNLMSLNGLVVDYGRRDEYRWIPKGCEYFDAQLSAAGIPHQLVSFDGGHTDHVAQRILEYMLPFFSEVLTFEP